MEQERDLHSKRPKLIHLHGSLIETFFNSTNKPFFVTDFTAVIVYVNIRKTKLSLSSCRKVYHDVMCTYLKCRTRRWSKLRVHVQTFHANTYLKDPKKEVRFFTNLVFKLNNVK